MEEGVPGLSPTSEASPRLWVVSCEPWGTEDRCLVGGPEDLCGQGCPLAWGEGPQDPKGILCSFSKWQPCSPLRQRPRAQPGRGSGLRTVVLEHGDG